MDKLKKKIFTQSEIQGQPKLWVDTFHSISQNSDILDFLKSVVNQEPLNIVLTGAGTSAYIGETVEHLFGIHKGVTVKAIPTTTLVTHFKTYIDSSKPLLIISFARSGNSPESLAAVDIAQQYCEKVNHIAVTCNPEGRLAKKVKNMTNGFTVILPPESDDKGLAMTGSFTAMMLTAIYLSNKNGSEIQLNSIQQIADSANEAIVSCSPELKNLSYKDFDRIVFLGSGPLLGIARESHLKVQELTGGRVVGKFDSFLGFRHGPKAVVNENTILVFLFSPESEVFRYERDLVNEILQDGIAMHCIGVFCDQKQADELNVRQKIVFDLDETEKFSDFNLMLYVIPAQILGFYKSLELGLNPDSPSKNNVISRVVKGVTIYN